MIIVSIVPRTAYINWCARQNMKIDRFDFAFPQFAHLSEQPVYQQELYQDNENTGTFPFGYQPIYSEYRYHPYTYHGKMKSSLAFWGLGRKFDDFPTLNEDFITASFPQDIFALLSQDDCLLLQSYFNFTAIRPIPKFGWQ